MTDDELKAIEQWCKNAVHPDQTVERLTAAVRQLQAKACPTWVGPAHEDGSSYTIEWNDEDGTYSLTWETTGKLYYIHLRDAKVVNKQKWTHPMVRENETLRKENAELREHLTEAAWSIFDEHMAPSNRDDAPASDGWLVTNARSDALYYGDMLVRLGHVEKHPTAGVGRVQYYRPLKGDKK